MNEHVEHVREVVLQSVVDLRGQPLQIVVAFLCYDNQTRFDIFRLEQALLLIVEVCDHSVQLVVEVLLLSRVGGLR